MALLCCFWKRIVLSLWHENKKTEITPSFIPFSPTRMGWLFRVLRSADLKRKRKRSCLLSASVLQADTLNPEKNWVMLDLRNFWLKIKTLWRVQFTTLIKDVWFFQLVLSCDYDTTNMQQGNVCASAFPWLPSAAHTGKQVSVSCSLNDKLTPYS